MNPHYQQLSNVETTSSCATDGVASAELLELANTSVSEQMLDLEGSEFNEEFLKALLNNGVDFSASEHNAVPTNNTNYNHCDTLPVTGQENSTSVASGSSNNNFHQMYLPNVSGEVPLYSNGADPFSAVHLQPALSSSSAASSKRIIKPRAQLSNEEITKLLLTYISRILEARQSNPQVTTASNLPSGQISSASRNGNVPIASVAGRSTPQAHQTNVVNSGIPSRNPVNRNSVPTSVIDMDVSPVVAPSSPAKSKRSVSSPRHANMVTARSIVPISKNTARIDMVTCVSEVSSALHGNSVPIASTSYRTTSRTEPIPVHNGRPLMSHFPLKSSSTHKTGTSFVKQNIRRTKTSENFTAEPMDCNSSGGVTITKVTSSRAFHKKARPYNSLELPKINDPLGLMDQQHAREMVQPARTTTSSIATEMNVSNPEMDLSPLTQILKTVEAVPSLDAASKVQKKVANPLNQQPSKEDNKRTPSTVTTDHVAPINDMLSTVNNMPNLLDIQSVLKYVQKRRAMRKLYKKRSHSAGSIDDLKKENESSASLKAYIELLKAKSQRLQKQSIPANDLQSCMTTQSVVTNDDFEFLRSIGIDPNVVTTEQCTAMSLDESSQSNGWHSTNTAAPSEPTQPGVEAMTMEESNFVPVNCNNTPFSDSGTTGHSISQFSNATNGLDYPSGLFSDDLYHSVLADVDGANDNPATNVQTTTTYFDTSGGMNSLEVSHMEEELDNVAFKTTPEIQFTPDWSYTQGSIEVLIHGPFMSSSAQYTCYFGDAPVMGRLQHRGVLSCVCPGNAPGFVPVKVVWGQRLCTCSQLFEYKVLPTVSEPKDFALKESSLRSDLLSRIKLLNGCSVASEVTAFMNGNKHILLSHQQFEHSVIYFLEKMKFVSNEAGLIMPLKPDYRTTILHLAVLLGLEKVVRKIKELVSANAFHLSWKSEFSPWTQDENMCSPLMLSCQLGNINISMLLLDWEPDTATLTDFNGVTPVQCALQRGHLSLVTELEKWIAAVAASQGDPQTTERTESSIQGPYSANIFPMSSELYATDLEDLLQSCGSDILHGNPINDKDIEKAVASVHDTETLTPPTPTAEHGSCTSGAVNTVVDMDNSLSGIDSTDESSGCSPLPMFISSTPLNGSITNSNDVGLTISELASGTTHLLDNSVPSSSLLQQPLMDRSQVRNPFQLGSSFAASFAALDSHHKNNVEISAHFSDFRSTSPLLSSPSERSSVLSGSPSSLSIASDCSVAEICEMLGESPSVCQQDFSFPGLSDTEQREIYHAARTIQHAFRKRKIQSQKLRHSKEKHAAVLIETCYKRYKEMKQMNQAAGLIQKYYRKYKNSLARSKELERAALFIQQMYRYQHRMKRMAPSL